MIQPTRTCRTDASWTVKSNHWWQGFLAGPMSGLLDGTVARWWPLAPPRAAAAPLVPAPRTAPSNSLGHQQLGGR